MAAGGGGLGLVVLVVALLLGVNPNDLTNVVGQASSASTENVSEINNLAEQCRTGADANTREDCRVVGFVNSIQAFWTDEFARHGAAVRPGQDTAFHGVNAGRLWIRYRCGRAVLLSEPTRWSIWTSRSSTNCTRALALGAAHSRRRTCWLTSYV